MRGTAAKPGDVVATPADDDADERAPQRVAAPSRLS